MKKEKMLKLTMYFCFILLLSFTVSADNFTFQNNTFINGTTAAFGQYSFVVSDPFWFQRKSVV